MSHVLAGKFTGRLKTPLFQLPLIEIPFEKIVIDLVGPFDENACEHHFILILVDYAVSVQKHALYQYAVLQRSLPCYCYTAIALKMSGRRDGLRWKWMLSL